MRQASAITTHEAAPPPPKTTTKDSVKMTAVNTKALKSTVATATKAANAASKAFTKAQTAQVKAGEAYDKFQTKVLEHTIATSQGRGKRLTPEQRAKAAELKTKLAELRTTRKEARLATAAALSEIKRTGRTLAKAEAALAKVIPPAH